MAILLLMRHAKSSWADQVRGDRLRPLNARGRSDARLMAKWLADEGLTPDNVIMSDAARAVETWEFMAPTFPGAGATSRPELYMAGTEGLISLLRSTAENTKTLLLIGHEPGISNTALQISREPFAPGIRTSMDRFGTANIAVIKLHDGNWSKLRRNAGTCTRLVRPADLKTVARHNSVSAS